LISFTKQEKGGRHSFIRERVQKGGGIELWPKKERINKGKVSKTGKRSPIDTSSVFFFYLKQGGGGQLPNIIKTKERESRNLGQEEGTDARQHKKKQTHRLEKMQNRQSPGERGGGTKRHP